MRVVPVRTYGTIVMGFVIVVWRLLVACHRRLSDFVKCLHVNVMFIFIAVPVTLGNLSQRTSSVELRAHTRVLASRMLGQSEMMTLGLPTIKPVSAKYNVR
jgi:hypothetical protein